MRVLYAEAVYGDEEIDAVNQVLREQPHALMGGKHVKLFEQKVATIFGKKYGVMVNSGSSANILAISSLRLPKGSEVITPALTFSTTVSPLVQCGLVPAFVDIELSTFLIDIDLIEEMITENTKAMLIPNLIGNLPNWEKLRELADQNDLALIEDSADTIGYKYRGGTTDNLSDIVTSSFYASHVITAAGFGGILCTNEERIARKATIRRSWGRASSLREESEDINSRFDASIDGFEYDAKFMFDEMGFNFIPSELSAAFGLVQLNKLELFKNIRQKNYAALLNSFRKFEDWLILPTQLEFVETPMLAFPFIIKDTAPFTRRQMQIYLENNQIQTRTIFTGNILRQTGFKDIDRREAKCGYPNSDQVMKGGMLIGCHQGLTDVEVAYIVDCVQNFANQF